MKKTFYIENLCLQSEFSYNPTALFLKLISNILMAVEVYLLHYHADVASHHVHSSLAQDGSFLCCFLFPLLPGTLV